MSIINWKIVIPVLFCSMCKLRNEAVIADNPEEYQQRFPLLNNDKTLFLTEAEWRKLRSWYAGQQEPIFDEAFGNEMQISKRANTDVKKNQTSTKKHTLRSILDLNLLDDIRAMYNVQTFKGRPSLLYQNKELRAATAKKCFLKMCGEDRKCAASFNNATYRCTGWMLPAQVLFWDVFVGRLLIAIDNELWITMMYIPPHHVPAPRIFWLFDRVSKSRNLAQFGDRFDLPTTELKWNALGPRGLNSDMRYVTLGSNTRGRRYHVGLRYKKKDDLVMFSLTLTFTIAMWIKTDFEGYMRIFSGLPKGYPFLGFWDSNRCNHLKWMPTLSTVFLSDKNDTGIKHWRHITIVHQAGSEISFFLNGNTWAFEKQPDQVPKIQHPYEFQLWNWYASENYFRGSMACFVMFQRILSLPQIRQVMENCP